MTGEGKKKKSETIAESNAEYEARIQELEAEKAEKARRRELKAREKAARRSPAAESIRKRFTQKTPEEIEQKARDIEASNAAYEARIEALEAEKTAKSKQRELKAREKAARRSPAAESRQKKRAANRALMQERRKSNFASIGKHLKAMNNATAPKKGGSTKRSAQSDNEGLFSAGTSNSSGGGWDIFSDSSGSSKRGKKNAGSDWDIFSDSSGSQKRGKKKSGRGRQPMMDELLGF